MLLNIRKATRQPAGDKQYIIYDSRAAVYEKLERQKDALLDAKTTILLAPDKWQGYARAARLLIVARKFDASLKMVDMALARIKAQNTKRRVEIEQIRQEALRGQNANQEVKRSAHSSIGKLPVELLGEIFHLVVDWDSASLITVLRICRHWRNIVLNTPSLWQTLVLSQRAPVLKLRFWITHSKDRIRELRVGEGAQRHPDWPFKDLETIPWHNLRVCKVELWDVAKYLERSISRQRPFSQLEELVIENLHNVSPSPSLYRLLQASKLRSIELSEGIFSWNLISTCLRSLTHLKVVGSCTDLGYLLPALEANPSLTKVVIITQSTFKYTRSSPLLLSNLTHIELAGSWASSLLAVIAMPALEVLHIRGAGGSLDTSLKNAVHRSSHLRHLNLNHCSFTPSVLVAFIKQTPRLTNLTLISLSQGVNDVVEALSWTELEKDDWLCPALTHLDLSHSPDVKTGSLVRLVRSRAHCDSSVDIPNPTPNLLTRAKLLALVIDGCEQVDADWIPWFRKNIPFVSCVYHTKKKASWKR